MKYVFSNEAEKDLGEILDFVRKESDDEVKILRFYHTARNRPTKWNSL